MGVQISLMLDRVMVAKVPLDFSYMLMYAPFFDLGLLIPYVMYIDAQILVV